MRCASQQWREVGLGAQILRDLGVASIRQPRDLVAALLSWACRGFGIEIFAETQPLEG